MLPIVLTLAMMPVQNTPDISKGSALYRNCQITVKTFNNNGGPVDDFASSALCIAYIDGFIDGLGMRSAPPICYSGASLVTMARVYIAYMDRYPKLFDEGKSVGVVNALVEAYPCPAKK